MSLKLRPAVLEFAEAMERKLQTHDRDRGKRVDGFDAVFCFERLEEAMAELKEKWYIHDLALTAGSINPARLGVQNEAVDVANYSMMLWHSMKPVPVGKRK